VTLLHRSTTLGHSLVGDGLHAVLVQTVERLGILAITAGMTEPTSAQDLFKGRHFDQEIIILCVRWYITFKLSFRDLVQMMAERGITLTHTTILRWVQRYVPEFEKRWKRYALPVGNSWRVDETYIKVRGQWVYLYRAVDKEGRTVDFLLSKRLDVATAKRFFSRAAKQHGTSPGLRRLRRDPGSERRDLGRYRGPECGLGSGLWNSAQGRHDQLFDGRIRVRGRRGKSAGGHETGPGQTSGHPDRRAVRWSMTSSIRLR
jgi:DDE domain